jgi:hypothetical protein
VAGRLPRSLHRARFVFDLRALGSTLCSPDYYVVPVTGEAFARCRLGEGAGIGAFTTETALGELNLVPCDSFAVYMRSRQGGFR